MRRALVSVALTRVAVVASTLAVVAGCGGESAPATDAGPIVGADGGAPALVAAPQIPWLDPTTGDGEPPVAPPNWRPCPSGWREVTTSTGLDVCDPYPASGAATCAVDEAHFPGEPGCARIGDACPAGDFPEGLPAGASVRYVLASATAGGDGTTALPFRTIGEATAGAAPGTIIAIGKGRYDELVAVPMGVTLWGACVAETIITQSAGVPLGTEIGMVTVSAPGAVVRNLQLADGELIGIWTIGAGQLEVRDVLVARQRTQGIFALRGGRIVARGVVVRDMRPRVDSRSGNGFGAEGGSLDLARVVIERARYAGIVAASAATVQATDLVIRDTGPDVSTDRGGYGILGDVGTTIEVTRALVEGGHYVGIASQGLGATFTGTDLVVRGTMPQVSDGATGAGVGANRSARIELRHALVEASFGQGIGAQDAMISAEDIVVRDIRQAPGEDFAMGALAGRRMGTSAGIVLRRVVIEGVTAGIQIDGAGTTATLEDVRIRDTYRAAGTGTRTSPGLSVFASTVEARRLVVERVMTQGIQAVGVGTRLTLEDVAVRDARSNPGGAGFGIGLLAQGGTIDATRVVVARSEGANALFTMGATAMLTDVAMLTGRAVPEILTEGVGVVVQRDATVNLARVALDDHLGLSLLAVASGHVEGTDVRVSTTARFACADALCSTNPGGMGVASVTDATLRLDRFAITSSALCGALVAEGGSLDLHAGEVRGAMIGACVQIDGYDTTRLASDVIYRDNGTTLSATTLPVPMATEL